MCPDISFLQGVGIVVFAVMMLQTINYSMDCVKFRSEGRECAPAPPLWWELSMRFLDVQVLVFQYAVCGFNSMFWMGCPVYESFSARYYRYMAPVCVQ